MIVSNISQLFNSLLFFLSKVFHNVTICPVHFVIITLADQIEHLITKTNEEALGRKEILEKVEKWFAACQEESWLEEYNRVM